MFKVILNLLFPQKCVGCQKENEILCEECFEKIDSADLSQASGIFAASNYSDPVIRETIRLLKYKRAKNAAEPLARLMRKRVWEKIKLKDALVVPIPLSKKRLRQRGFNQAELIARCLLAIPKDSPSELQRRVLWEVRSDILYKKIHTDSQVSIKDKEKRLTNLIGSFAVADPQLVKGKNIILIDDVCTTGATIKEAKKILKEAGAKRVIAMVVARG
ncbi:MAG: ComF family protein [Patescibacteria group bacterium]